VIKFTIKLHKAIPMVVADACATLIHTLFVIIFCFIRSFFAMGCPTGFAAEILKIVACSCNLACKFKGRFYMVLKGPFLSGTRFPVDQILLLGCWYMPIPFNPCFFGADFV